MNRLLALSLLTTVAWMIGSAKAQNSLPEGEFHRYTTRTTQYGVGYTDLYDTYLSPQAYRGTEVRILRESMRFPKWGRRHWSLQTLFQGNAAYGHNRAETNNTLGGLIHYNYALHYHFHVSPQLRLLAGGAIAGEGGFLYNLRNSNNPASARAAMGLEASGMAIWNFRIKERPFTLRYQLNLPLAGLMFSPHYGQSYYEIFSLGNSSGVVCLTTPKNRPSLHQMLSFDFPLAGARMRLSYVGDIRQARLNGLRTHAYSHSFLVGVVRSIYRLPSQREPIFSPALQAY